ncbi:MAG: GNAT family N-acetyltransferase [Myxococcota bacterium]|nr:GNAT family N-acetyltransferase [Myxococcota bacterium]
MWKQTKQADFFTLNETVFRERETEFISLVTLSTNHLSDPSAFAFYTFIENGVSIGQAIRSRSRLEVGCLPQQSIASLVDLLATPRPSISEIRGFADSVDRFVPTWTQKVACQTELFLHTSLYTLHRLTLPPTQGGTLICATDTHRSIASKLMRGFIDDCFPEQANPTLLAEKHTKKLMAQKNLFLWKNREGEWVSLAAQVRTSWHTASISMVYTPPEHRGRGYGRCVTGMLSQKIMREQNRTCNLFADVKNPTSNYIYRSLGYEKINEEKSMFLRPYE